MDFDAGARKRTTGEMGFFGFDEMDSTVNGGVDGVIARLKSAWTGDFGIASLADDNFASFDFLATKTFDA